MYPIPTFIQDTLYKGLVPQMLFHTHKLHFPFKPGTFSLMRDTSLQKRTQESCRARMRRLLVTYPCKAAVSTLSSTALGQPSTFYLHFLPSPPWSALPSQQDFCSSGSLLLGRQWVAQQSCSQLGPHSSTVIIIITDENPFTIFLNYRSGIQCPAHIPE